MDEQTYRKLLSEVSDWEIPKQLEGASISSIYQRSKGRKNLMEEDLLEDPEQPAGQDCLNPTYPPKLLKLKHPELPCEDCGKMVRGRCKEAKLYVNKHIRAFKQRCLACDLHKDPYTGKFTLTGIEASVKWNSYCKPVNRRYELEKNLNQSLCDK
jgi:hypothetical protein